MKYTKAIALALLTALGVPAPAHATSTFPFATSGSRAGRWTALDGYRNGLIADPKGIYVDPSRPSSGDGTSAGTAVRTIAEGLALLQAGTRIRLWIKAGSTHTRTAVLDWPATIGGASQADPAGVYRYGAGARPIIESSDRTTAVFRVNNSEANWIAIVGIHLRMSGAWVASNTRGTGIEWLQSPSANILIEHNIVEGCGNGILVQRRVNVPSPGDVNWLGNVTIRQNLIYRQSSRTAAVADANPNGTTDSVSGPWDAGVTRPARTAVAVSVFGADEITCEDNVIGMSAAQWAAGESANHNTYFADYNKLTAARNVLHGAGLDALNCRSGGLQFGNLIIGPRYGINNGSGPDTGADPTPHTAALLNWVTRSLYACGAFPSDRDNAKILGRAFTFEAYTTAGAFYNFITDGYIGVAAPADANAETTPVDCFPFQIRDAGNGGSPNRLKIIRNYLGRWQRPIVQGDRCPIVSGQPQGSPQGASQVIELRDNIIDTPCATNIWYGSTGFPTFEASGNIYRTPLDTDLVVDRSTGYAARNAAQWATATGETIQTSASTLGTAPLYLRQYAALNTLGTTEGDVFDAVCAAYVADSGDAPIADRFRADYAVDWLNSLIGLYTIGPVVPLAPTGVTVSRVNNGDVAFPTVSWAHGGEGVESFEVQQSTSPAFTSNLYRSVGLAPSVRINPMPAVPAGVYYYRVRAINAAGPSSWSSVETLNTWTPAGAGPSVSVQAQRVLSIPGRGSVAPVVLGAGSDPSSGMALASVPSMPASIAVLDRDQLTRAQQIERVVNAGSELRGVVVFNEGSGPARVLISLEAVSNDVNAVGRLVPFIIEPAAALPGTAETKTYRLRRLSTAVIGFGTLATPGVSGPGVRDCSMGNPANWANILTQVYGCTVVVHPGNPGPGSIRIDGLPPGIGLVLSGVVGDGQSYQPGQEPESVSAIRAIVSTLASAQSA